MTQIPTPDPATPTHAQEEEPAMNLDPATAKEAIRDGILSMFPVDVHQYMGDKRLHEYAGIWANAAYRNLLRAQIEANEAAALVGDKA